MIRVDVMAASGIGAFPVLALLLASLGGWPGIAGALVTCAAFLAAVVWFDCHSPRRDRDKMSDG